TRRTPGGWRGISGEICREPLALCDNFARIRLKPEARLYIVKRRLRGRSHCGNSVQANFGKVSLRGRRINESFVIRDHGMSADGARKLFVGALAESGSEAEIRAVFEGAGFVVEHLALPRDRDTGRLRGFAFITLGSEEEANAARAKLQGVNCAGRPLSIREFSQEPPKRGPGATGPGGGSAGGRERAPQQSEPTVFLGKLPFEATQDDIQELFAAQGVGPVTRVTLPLGPDGRPLGFGFATLTDQDQVDAAVAKINGASLRGRQIVVSPAQPKGAGAGRDNSGPRRGPAGPGGPRFGDRSGSGGGDFAGESGGGDFEGPPLDGPMFVTHEGKG